jgi:hypothetical protein
MQHNGLKKLTIGLSLSIFLTLVFAQMQLFFAGVQQVIQREVPALNVINDFNEVCAV